MIRLTVLGIFLPDYRWQVTEWRHGSQSGDSWVCLQASVLHGSIVGVGNDDDREVTVMQNNLFITRL